VQSRQKNQPIPGCRSIQHRLRRIARAYLMLFS